MLLRTHVVIGNCPSWLLHLSPLRKEAMLTRSLRENDAGGKGILFGLLLSPESPMVAGGCTYALDFGFPGSRF